MKKICHKKELLQEIKEENAWNNYVTIEYVTKGTSETGHEIGELKLTVEGLQGKGGEIIDQLDILEEEVNNMRLLVASCTDDRGQIEVIDD